MTFRERFHRARQEASQAVGNGWDLPQAQPTDEDEGLSLSRLADIAGYCGGGDTVVVTDRGVEIPISLAPDDWTVVQFTRLLGQISAWPETDHPLGACE